MQITTMGLVLRATKTGENDRVLSVLTPELGIISAIAKGSLRLKNKLFSSTGLFCYSEFTLFEGKNMYTVNEAEVQEVFIGLHEDITSMALAMYIAELASILAPHGEESKIQLKLALNTFYFLSKKKRDALQLKIIFELRTMCNSGYMPNLVACEKCMCYDAKAFYFDNKNACIMCENCAKQRGIDCNIDAAGINAMRHIAFSEENTLFNFVLNGNSLGNTAKIIENYVLSCIDKKPKTLEFLQSVL